MITYLAKALDGLPQDDARKHVQSFRDLIIGTDGADIRHDLSAVTSMVYFTVRDLNILNTLRLAANGHIQIQEPSRAVRHAPSPK